jgi:hypothetical protein
VFVSGSAATSGVDYTTGTVEYRKDIDVVEVVELDKELEAPGLVPDFAVHILAAHSPFAEAAGEPADDSASHMQRLVFPSAILRSPDYVLVTLRDPLDSRVPSDFHILAADLHPDPAAADIAFYKPPPCYRAPPLPSHPVKFQYSGDQAIHAVRPGWAKD